MTFYDSFLTWNITNMLFAFGKPPTGWQFLSMLLVGLIPFSTLTPRFILDVRELYARDVRGRGYSEIDSGFGLSALSDNVTSRSAVVSVDAEPNGGGLAHGEEIPMEEQTA